jgi:uncharacterized membrane protein YheB (UPF0754 family)
MFNKNVLPNLLAAALVAISFLFPDPYQAVIFSTGLFALSGALTNWLAVHMLFEKVPGLHGSGVIVTHFEQFKTGILKLVHEQLFSKDKVQKVLSNKASSAIDLEPILKNLDLDAAYDQLVATVMDSSFGSMLGVLGGEGALDSMRDPFKKRMGKFLHDAAESPRFQAAINEQVQNMTSSDQFLARLDTILRERLDELTPEMVRDIMQGMIRKHLGWLVVWGGVFGGLIGLAAGLLQLL